MSKRTRSNPIVRIQNARKHEAQYTTLKKAMHHIERGVAEWVKDAKGDPIAIIFVQAADRDRLAPQRIDFEREQAILRDRKGVIFWNGCDDSRGACHLPFTGPDFPRPGAKASTRSDRAWADRLHSGNGARLEPHDEAGLRLLAGAISKPQAR